MLDLDAFEAKMRAAAGTIEGAASAIESEWGDGAAYQEYEVADGLLRTDVPALVAELRAAREVVEAAGPVILNPHLPGRLRRLHEARDAYNKVAGGGS